MDVGLLALVAGIAALVVGIILLTDGGTRGLTAAEQAAIQRRTDLRPLMNAIVVPPADLPPGWTPPAAGPGFQGTLRGLDLGPATSVAESEVGEARSWVLADDPRLLDAGPIVAESPEGARAAFERLRSATSAVTHQHYHATDIITVRAVLT